MYFLCDSIRAVTCQFLLIREYVIPIILDCGIFDMLNLAFSCLVLYRHFWEQYLVSDRDAKKDLLQNSQFNLMGIRLMVKNNPLELSQYRSIDL